MTIQQQRSLLGLVNKPNITYQFENILKYQYGILQIGLSNIGISEFRNQPQYRLKMILLVCDYIILMILS